MNNKAALLQKIKNLAERGVAGEQENAREILEKLMEKYGITEADLSEGEKRIAWFAYGQETEHRLLNQIIYMVTGEAAYGCVGKLTGRKHKKVGAKCTAAEQIEIKAAYIFFKRAMEAELEIFHAAFASKNHLFPAKDATAQGKEHDEADVQKIRAMMAGMDRHEMRKAIPNRAG